MKTKRIGDINFVRCVAILTDASLEDYSTDYTLQSGEKIPVVKLGQLIENKETKGLSLNKNNAWSVTADTDVLVPQELHFVFDQIPRKQYDKFIFFGDHETTFHAYHSDAGYGVKTWTYFQEKDGSSLILATSKCSCRIAASTKSFNDIGNSVGKLSQEIIDLYVAKKEEIKEIWVGFNGFGEAVKVHFEFASFCTYSI